MNKFNVDSDFFNYNFFVIDSNNLENIQSRLYGYVIFDNKIFINGFIEDIPLYANGSYVNICKYDHHINIQQDYNGSYGLYFFKHEDYFALSNSFLYLLTYLHGKVNLSLNSDYAKYFITDDLASLSVSETLVNEIQLLSKNIIVDIDIHQAKIEFTELNHDIQKVPLDSESGVAILDNWYRKWQNLLLGLNENHENILVDLTGGMDSRATFSIFNHHKIDFDKIEVRSHIGELHTFKEDYEIASIIAKKQNFKLNKSLNLKKYPLSVNTSMNASFFVKLGIHKQMYFKQNYCLDRCFYFTGFGGETIRTHWEDSEKFIQDRKKMGSFVSIDCSDSIEKIILKSLIDVGLYNKNFSDIELMRSLYENTRLRSHFGKNTVECFLSNIICLNPLMDIELQKIYTNNNLLLCTIYDRYLKNIKDVKFDSNRVLELEYIEYAKSINDKYTYKPFEYVANKLKIDDYTEVRPSVSKDCSKPRERMMDFFALDKIKNEIIPLFGYEVYHKASLNWSRGGYFSDSLACCLIAIAIAKYYTHQIADFDIDEKLFDNSKMVIACINFLKMARVDIKNKNTGNYKNNILWHNKGDAHITTPFWFQSSDGIGYVIESHALKLHLEGIAIGSGNLVLALKGIDIRNDNNNRFSHWITFTSVKVNGIEQLLGEISVWHDNPYSLSIPVKNQQKISIIFEWKPYAYEKTELINMIEKIFKYLPFPKAIL